MNLNDFVIFQAVAEHNSFTKAAAETNTVQSNVTARIKALEEYFKVRLFERTSRSIKLTDEGSQILKVAKEVQLLLENARVKVGGNAPVRCLIKIGCIHTTAALRAPGIIKDFTDEYPHVEFRLKTGTSASLLKDVLSCKLDAAFVAGNVHVPELHVRPVITEELCMVTSAFITDAEQIMTSPKPLKLIVFSNGCSYRKHFENFLSSTLIKQFTAIEVDTLEGIINAVEEGVGITILPVALMVKYYNYRNLKTFPLPGHFARMQTSFIRRKDLTFSDSHQRFFNTIENGYLNLLK